MNSELLKSDLDAAIEAELESDAQVRDLPRRIAEASKPNSRTSASDMAKTASTTIAINKELREKTEALSKAYDQAVRAEVAATLPAYTGPKPHLQRVRAMAEAMKKHAAKRRGDN